MKEKTGGSIFLTIYMREIITVGVNTPAECFEMTKNDQILMLIFRWENYIS